MTEEATATPQQQGTTDTKLLRGTIEFMDCLSQGGFSEISTIAKLALSRLETPEGWHHIDDIVNALLAIRGKADDIMNSINYEAERVGCNYIDPAQRKRWDAMRAHREAVEAADLNRH